MKRNEKILFIYRKKAINKSCSKRNSDITRKRLLFNYLKCVFFKTKKKSKNPEDVLLENINKKTEIFKITK